MEADDVYLDKSPLKVKCPKHLTIAEDRKAMMQRVHTRQQTINKRFKQLGILKQCYRHDPNKHHDIFAAIAVISQLAVQNENPLFDVEYSDQFNFLLLSRGSGFLFFVVHDVVQL